MHDLDKPAHPNSLPAPTQTPPRESLLTFSEDNNFIIVTKVAFWDWLRRFRMRATRTQSNHVLPPGRPCLGMPVDLTLRFNPVITVSDQVCFITVGCGPNCATDANLYVNIWVQNNIGKERICLQQIEVPKPTPLNSWVELILPLESLPAGDYQFEIETMIDSGPRVSGPLIYLYEFVVCRKQQLGLHRARSFYKFRYKNEVSIFSDTYDAEIYNTDSSSGDAGIDRNSAKESQASQHQNDVALSREKSSELSGAEEISPSVPITDLLSYYGGLMDKALGISSISFADRLANKIQKRTSPIRILSLAAGAARVELDLLRGLNGNIVEITLVDINPKLLQAAKRRLATQATVNIELQDINKISLKPDEYDIVICVSALHHVIELEHLIKEIRNSLSEDGEFWNIGEYIGRTGSRLYDDAYEVANGFFRTLPSRLRQNNNPGNKNVVDEDLPNWDCSATCFEGIRSDEILGLLSAEFDVREIVTKDCFAWRLFNLAYLGNYQLDSETDMELVNQAVLSDVDFLRNGGAPVSLNGVFGYSS